MSPVYPIRVRLNYELERNMLQITIKKSLDIKGHSIQADL